MRTIAVVPAKNPYQSKSRLAGALSPEERAALTQSMLAHVLEAIEASGVAGAVDQPEAREVTCRLVKLADGPVAPLLELLPSVAEQPRAAGERLRIAACGGVDGEGLGGGAGERVGEPLDRALGFGPVGGGVRVDLPLDRVHVGVASGAVEGSSLGEIEATDGGASDSAHAFTTTAVTSSASTRSGGRRLMERPSRRRPP